MIIMEFFSLNFEKNQKLLLLQQLLLIQIINIIT